MIKPQVMDISVIPPGRQTSLHVLDESHKVQLSLPEIWFDDDYSLIHDTLWLVVNLVKCKTNASIFLVNQHKSSMSIGHGFHNLS